MAERFSGFLRRGRRVAPIEAAGFEDRAAVLSAGTAAAVLVVAELCLLVGGLVAGAAAWSGALVALLVLAAVRGDRPDGRLAVALAVVPILRLASLALPAIIVPVPFWYVLIAVPAFAAIALAARFLRLRPADLGLRPTSVRDTAVLAAAGVPLGLAAWVIAEADPLPAGTSNVDLVLLSIAVIVFGAFLEELLLRGLVQRVAGELLGDWAVAASVALTGLLYLSSLNLRYVVLMVAVAVLFGIVARRSGSIAATTAGHVVLLWTQAVLWPVVLG